MTPHRPTYIVRFRPEPNVDAVRALRNLLRVALRRFGLRVVGIVEASSEAPEAKS